MSAHSSSDYSLQAFPEELRITAKDDDTIILEWPSSHQTTPVTLRGYMSLVAQQHPRFFDNVNHGGGHKYAGIMVSQAGCNSQTLKPFRT